MSRIKTTLWIIEGQSVGHAIIVDIVGSGERQYARVVEVAVDGTKLLRESPVGHVPVTVEERTTEDGLSDGTIGTLSGYLAIVVDGIEVLAIVLHRQQAILCLSALHHGECLAEGLSGTLAEILVIAGIACAYLVHQR